MTKCILTNVNIDAICNEVGTFLDKCKVDHKDTMRVKLMVEETLLNCQEHFGEKQEVSMVCKKRFGRPSIKIRIIGERFNPFESINEDEPIEESSAVLHGILANMGVVPDWEYRNGVNHIHFVPRRKPTSQVVQLSLSFIAAVVCGFLCLLLPESLRMTFSEKLIVPIFGSFMGLLSAIAGPMIFFAVVWGIYSIGDTATLGTIGKRMIKRILSMAFLLSILGTMSMLPFFDIESDGATSFDFYAFLKLILDIIPSNFFAPFVTGNSLQIIFVAVAIGMAMLILGNKTTVAATLTEQSNYIVMLLMETISKFVPAFIFGSIFNMIISGEFSALVNAYKILPVMIIGQIVIMFFYLSLVSWRRRVSPKILLKKTFESFLIALTTASSSAAFASNMETCEKKLGINQHIVNFGVPLGQIIYMLGTSMMFVAAALGMAEIYNISISPIWITTAIFISVILSIANPPIPGAPMMSYPILFAQLNIPMEAVPIIIALNVIMDFLGTACSIFTLQLELVELAGDLKMLDYDVLRKDM